MGVFGPVLSLADRSQPLFQRYAKGQASETSAKHAGAGAGMGRRAKRFVVASSCSPLAILSVCSRME